MLKRLYEAIGAALVPFLRPADWLQGDKNRGCGSTSTLLRALLILATLSLCAVHLLAQAPGVIGTVAGDGQTGYSGDGGSATANYRTELNYPNGIAMDLAGNLYIADTYNSRIRKVTASTGIISTVAGNGTVGYSGDGGAATNAALRYPFAVTVDSVGNLYIADSYNDVVRMVSASTGVITTVAGNGSQSGCSGDGGPATSGELNTPFGLAMDASGNLYIADTVNNRVRKVTTSTGIITTVAGSSICGYGGGNYSGDGGLATNAALNEPTGIVLDSTGNLYIADYSNQRIREVIASTGVITTVAGNGNAGYSGDGGAATGAQLYRPLGISLDTAGNLYIADSFNGRIREVAASTGVITTVAGGGTAGFGDGGLATNATLSTAYVITDSSGNLYISEGYGDLIRKVTASSGIITTVAGTNKVGYSGDGEAATAIDAELNWPQGVAADSAGNVYIADTSNSVIRKITASSGIISTIVGIGSGYSGDGGAATAARLNYPVGVSVDSAANLYIADTGNCVIRKVTASSGIITTVAGVGGYCGYSGDGGAATAANLNTPSGVAVDSSGNLYIADTGNCVIRYIAAGSGGTITTIAGVNGDCDYLGDGGAATAASLNTPTGVAVDSSGNLYIADTYNCAIRYVTAGPSGIINTIAGVNGSCGYLGDGGAANAASLNYPSGVALDSSGNLYIADASNSVVRKVSAGTITTVAGDGAYGYSGDGGLAVEAKMANPVGVAVDSTGHLYIVDADYSVVRSVGRKTNPKLTPSITWNTPAAIMYGTALSTSQLNATANVAGHSVYSPAAGTVLGAGSYTLSVTFTPTDITDYTVVTSTTTLVVSRTTPTISWATPLSIRPGTALSATQLDAAANVTGSFSYSPASGTVLAMGSQILSATFTPTDSADYNTATATVTLMVSWAPAGMITTVAGNGTLGYSGNGGAATSAELTHSFGVTVDPSGNIYIADGGGHIRKVNAATGIISTVAGNGNLYSGSGVATGTGVGIPFGVAVDAGGNIYISDSYDSRVLKVNATTGILTSVAGNGTSGYHGGDGGPATSAGLYGPSGISVDASGNLYIADFSNSNVRKVNSAGIISTVAGNLNAGYSGDGGAATSTELNGPEGVSTDTSGNIYIADTYNNRIRKVNAAGIITTVAGNGIAGYSGDGGAATSAELNQPEGVYVDASGNIYIADGANNSIRKVSPAGVITTVAGNGTAGYSGDGGPATSAELNFSGYGLGGVYVDSAGSIYISDPANNRIRAVGPVGNTLAITVTTSGSPSVYGSPVTFTATVPGGDTNTVTFYNGNTTLGTATPSSGIASLTVSNLAVGVNPITASIAAGSGYPASTSDLIDQIVSVLTSTISVSNIPSNAGFGGGFTAMYSYSGDGMPNVSSSTPSVCATVDNNVYYLSAGACTLQANAPATADYAAATGVAQSFTVSPPTINSLSPTSGPESTPVTIAGLGFGFSPTTTTVAFNGLAANIVSWSNTSIVAVVPVGATTGNVVVTANGTASNGVMFTVQDTTPTITSLSASSGNAGLAVTISGVGFGVTKGQSTITFGGSVAGVLNWSDSSITAIVPANAMTGPVVVTLSDGQVSNNNIVFTLNSSSCDL